MIALTGRMISTLLTLLRRATVSLVVILMPYAGYASSLGFSTEDNNHRLGLTVVEVLGSLRGSGILVLWNDRPVVLTNSHNLQGLKEVQLYLPVRTQRVRADASNGFNNLMTVTFKGPGKLLYDDPFIDFAIVGLPEKLSGKTLEIIHAYAEINGRFDGRGWVPYDAKLHTPTMVAAVLNGKNMATQTVDGRPPTFTKASITIPAYSRPGVSGGALYDHGLLVGLINKVSLIGEPVTMAIPLPLIAESLRGSPVKRLSLIHI